jgi:hypothetical protein
VEHVVFFPAADGAPAFRRVSALDEAVRLVEHLRNVEGISSVSCHALTEVPLAFRTYYRVEVPEAVVPAQQVAEPAPVLELAPVAVEPLPEPAAELAPESIVDVEPVHEAPALALVEDVPAEGPALAASNGHSATPPASLGFFA